MIEFQSLLESVDIPSYFVYSSHLKVKTTKLELHVYLNTTHVVFEAQNPSKVVWKPVTELSDDLLFGAVG